MNVPMMKALQMRARVQKQNNEFLKKHHAVETLHGMDHYVSHFLAKRVGQGLATVKWEVVHQHCLRLTVTYRGQDWVLRVPVSE
jgi:hypothetical protein